MFSFARIWANCGQLQGCVTTVLVLREGKRLAGVAKTLSLSLLRFDLHLSLSVSQGNHSAAFPPSRL
jgi:hypothetical protein